MSTRSGSTGSALRRALGSLFTRQEGQAALEFLLLIPTYVIFLLITVDFGVLMYEYVSVNNAAREGARYGATNCGSGSCAETAVRTRTIERSGGILSAANSGEITVGWIDVTTNGTGSNRNRGDSVIVRINHAYSFLFAPVGPTVPVFACADMRLERNDNAGSLPTTTAC